MQQNIKNFIRNMTEYFTLLHEFSKLGDEESKFLISIQCITTVVNFYLSLKGHEQVHICLSKMIFLSLLNDFYFRMIPQIIVLNVKMMMKK